MINKEQQNKNQLRAIQLWAWVGKNSQITRVINVSICFGLRSTFHAHQTDKKKEIKTSKNILFCYHRVRGGICNKNFCPACLQAQNAVPQLLPCHPLRTCCLGVQPIIAALV